MSVMCSRPSMPPRSTNAPSSVRFLTTPLSTAPSTSFSSSASRSSECSLSTTARRETTTLLRLRSSLMSLNSSSLPSRYTGSRTGRTSTREPGRNARTSLMSTVKPPLTLPLMRPVTVSFFSRASSSSSHTMARLAFSRDSTVSPKPFSSASSATLTVSPTPTSISPSSLRNCSIGTMPSDFRPALMTTTSERTSTTVPVTIAPGLSLAMWAWLCSNSSAKDSVAAGVMLVSVGAHGIVLAGGLGGLPGMSGACLLGGEFQYARDDRVDRHPRGVDADGVLGRPQRRNRAAGIARVTGQDLPQQTVQCNGNPFVLQLLIAPFRTLLGARGQEHLPAGVREDHRAHVAAVRDQPGRLAEGPLAIAQGRPDLGDRGDRRGRGAGGLGAQLVGGVVPVQQHPQLAVRGLAETDLGIEGAADQGPGVVQVEVGPAGGDPHGPVECARVQVVPAQVAGDAAADGALARARGPVDGKDRDGVVAGIRHRGIVAADRVPGS